MSNSNITLFTNDSGGTASSADYVRDAFKDFSLPANSNTGLTDTASTNPMGLFFGNDDSLKYSVKTLWIKDLVKINNKAKWIDNKPTYKVIWSETWPGLVGYVFGDFFVSAAPGSPVEGGAVRIDFKGAGDGFGVTGKIRQAAFFCENKTVTATGQFVIDGSNGSTVDLSGAYQTGGNGEFYPYTNSNPYQPSFAPRLHSTTPETNDLHDIRITSVQGCLSTTARPAPFLCALSVTGVTVLYENSGANLEVFPGVTYVDKSKNTTTTGATYAVPTFGSSMGGMASIVKSQTSGYSLITRGFSTVLSNAIGSSGTNLLTVTAGSGASFPAGSGVVIDQGGGSHYIGSVTNVSTDTLTVSPTLPFGISNAVYRAWLSGPTMAINASLLTPFKTIEFNGPVGFTQMVYGDPEMRCYAWGNNGQFNRSMIDGENVLYIGASTNGFLAVEGRFCAADIEFLGPSGILNCTLTVNGTPAWGVNSVQSRSIRRTAFTDAPYQWNQFVVTAGASMDFGIRRVTLYEPSSASSTFGVLGTVNFLPAFANRTAINATLSAFSTFQRVFANQLERKGVWEASQSAANAGGWVNTGSGLSSIISLTYYGKNVAVLGTPGGGTLTIDGVGVGLSFGFMHTVASVGWHTVRYNAGTGATAQIAAIDYTRTVAGVQDRQTVINQTESLLPGVPESKSFDLIAVGDDGYGSTAITTSKFDFLTIRSGTAAFASQSDVDGLVVFIQTPGVYAMSYQEQFSGGAGWMGITYNSTLPADNIETLSTDVTLAITKTPGADISSVVSVTSRLFTGDRIRTQTGAGTKSGNRSRFTMTRVGD